MSEESQRRKESKRRYRDRHRLQLRAKNRLYKLRNPEKVHLSRTRIRTEIIGRLGGCCAQCGFADIRALQLDHINGNGHGETRALGSNLAMYYQWHRWSSTKLKEHVQVLCANCNWIKRHENKEHRWNKPASKDLQVALW